jgi:hypothetical protein
MENNTQGKLLPCREAFEKWADENGYNIEREKLSAHTIYRQSDTAKAWYGWQAAWNTLPQAQPVDNKELVEEIDAFIMDCSGTYKDATIKAHKILKSCQLVSIQKKM